MKIEYLIINEDKEEYSKTVESFKALLLTSEIFKLKKDQLIVDSNDLKFHLEKQQVRTNDNIFYMCLEANEDQIDSLEKADDIIHRIIKHYKKYNITTLWDDISIYYGKKLYPIMNHIENQMRKLLYFFMVNALGNNWVKKATPKEIKEKIGMEPKVENYLHTISFNQLGKFFFSTFPKIELSNIIDKLKKLVKNNEEDKLSELITDFEGKSNWERYFCDQVKGIDLKKDLEKDWSILTEYRNKVAHCKEIHRDDYVQAIEVANRVKDVLERCLSQVGKLELSEDDATAIEHVYKDLGISDFMIHLSSMLDNDQTYPTLTLHIETRENHERIKNKQREVMEQYFNTLGEGNMSDQ